MLSFNLLCSLLLLGASIVDACPFMDGRGDVGENPHLRHLDEESSSDSVHRQLQTATNPRSQTEAIDIASRLIRQLKTDRPDENWAAKFIRLNFHDCVGGCDGCVDLANPSNFGLHIPIDALEPIANAVSQFLTIGDVWALAGVLAANDNQLGTTERFTFDLVGRPMCTGNATRAGPHREMPKAHFTVQQLLAFFQTNFDFTAKETVAIMGSHSLGRSFPANSGFEGEGSWDNDPEQLNNGYYKSLLSSQRFALVSNPPVLPSFPTENHFWEALPENGGHFMIHADMALAFDLSAHFSNADTGHVTCVMDAIEPGDVLCPSSSLLTHTQGYANSNTNFIRDFKAVFNKMINRGCGNGVCRPAVPVPTRAPVRVPTPAPVKPPTKAPTKAPVKPPTNAPVKPPTKAPTKAPVKPPTNAPVKPPTPAPVKAPTKAPVKPPTKAPVQAPMPVPVPVPVPTPTSTCAGYCNWGPAGTAASSTCNGQAQGGTWCNLSSNNCQRGCGGRWCTGCPSSTCNFQCPSNSVRIPGRSCYRSFDDCQCAGGGGFTKSGTQCVCTANFQCPVNSSRLPNRQCYNNFEDCVCNTGFVKSGTTCVRR